VVQETFLKLIAGAEKIEGRSRLSTWLYRVAYNASIDRLRDQKRIVPVPEEADDEAAAEALSVTETNLKVRLHRARLRLRERLSAFVAGRREGRA